MRIAPVEEPRGLVQRLMYAVMRRQFGKTITPWKVVFARAPRLIPSQLGIYWGLGGGLRIGGELQLLVQHHVAELNGCAFCVDIGEAVAVQQGLSLAKTRALSDYRTSELFSDRERAAFAYVEEATRNKQVSDTTFAALKRHFDDRQIVELTWICAIENYFNLINLPLGIESDGLCAIATDRKAA